jgi:DNA-directed RNA polymerase I subunit RPA1
METSLTSQAMERDSDSDNDDNEDESKKINSESDKYLVPLEVEAQFKLLWQNDGALLDFIWSRAVSSGRSALKIDANRYLIFFQRVVLVPPNRFRPPSRQNGDESLHPHTVHLTRILEANDKIKRISAQLTLNKKKSITKNKTSDELYDEHERTELNSIKRNEYFSISNRMDWITKCSKLFY